MMTQPEIMHRQMGGEGGGEDLIPAGAITFGLMYRTNVGEANDEGICIHVYGNDIAGPDKELLRFDCFRKTPHYHLGLSHRDAPHIEIDDADPFNWSLSLLASSFETLLQDAGADSTERNAWEIELAPALEVLRREAATLTPEK